MGISEVKTKETPDPEAETSLALEIGIKKQPGAVIDHDKVKIMVWLYDIVNDKDIKLTDADVSNEWLTPKHDWSDTNPEALLVHYVRAKTGGALSESSLSEAAAKVRPGQTGRSSKDSANTGQRKYLGYIVRVYYGDDLQAVQAEPARLLQVFLPHSDLPPEVLVAGVGTSSANPTPSEFAKQAMKLREQALPEVKPRKPDDLTPEEQAVVAAYDKAEPAPSRPQRYPWKMNIVTTVFWIGEKGNYRSVWDANWTTNYGGTDSPNSSARRNYIPIAFVPRRNPFYCALPYNDVTHGQFKPEAPLVIPWFKQAYSGPGQSVCRHRWIAIRKGNRVCYAQWEDCGPFRADHFQYVFGNERPKPNANHGAGLSVSPAARDYLGLAPTDVTDWQFVEVRDVPPGPWRNYGDNNHFVVARRQSEQHAREQTESEQITKKELEPSATPADPATIKKWVNEAIKRGEDWGHGDSKH